MTKKKNAHKVIPPLSVVKIARADDDTPLWKKAIGREYRIGYYRKRDGLDVIWLVDEAGDYCQTINHSYLRKYFEVVKLSRVTDLYGIRAKQIGHLSGVRKH